MRIKELNNQQKNKGGKNNRIEEERMIKHKITPNIPHRYTDKSINKNKGYNIRVYFKHDYCCLRQTFSEQISKKINIVSHLWQQINNS